MMGILAYREVVVPWLNTSHLPPRPNTPMDLWLGIYGGGNASERIGFLNARSTPEVRSGTVGVSMGLSARMELPVFSENTMFTLHGSAWMSNARGLSEFDFTFGSGGHEMRVQGEVKDNRLKASLETGGESLPFELPVSDELLLSGGMGMSAFDVPLLDPGTEIYVDAFDPTTMSLGKAKITCVGKEEISLHDGKTEAFLVTTSIGGITSRAWLAADGEVLQVETPFGFTLKKISPQEAMSPVSPGENADLVRSFAIRPKGVTPKRDAVMMRVKFSGVEEKHLPPSDAVQTRTPAGYIITVPEAPVKDPGAALSEEDRARYLQSDVFVTSDHPKIREAAANAVREETDPWKQAVRLHDWVFLRVKKKPVLSIPTALDVLQSLEGDCNEHAVLFVAMARAVQIPARIAVGVVWSEEFGAFGYHAWAEVFVGDWIPMDPTFGQLVADATHIKLLNGGIDQWPRLLPHIGAMQIEVLEVR